MQLNAQYYQGVLTLTHTNTIGHNWEIRKEDGSTLYELYEYPEHGGQEQRIAEGYDLGLVLKEALSLT